MAVNCRDVVQILRDGGVPDAASRQHLSTCESCAREQAFWRHVRGSLGEAPAQPPFLHARIMAAVRAEARETNESHPWFQVPWVRRWALPAATAALVVLGEGFSMMAFFRPAPDDLVVRWSEQEAILMAQNGTPVSPFPSASPADGPIAEIASNSGGLDRASYAAREGQGLPGTLSESSAQPTLPPASAVADGKLVAKKGDADEAAVSEPFEMAKARDAAGLESVEPRAVRSPAPSPAAAPPARAKEELGEKDSRGTSAFADRPAKAKGAGPIETRTQSNSVVPEGSSLPRQAMEATTPCRILSAETVVRRLDLPTSAAPPVGVRWTVIIDSDGRVVSTEVGSVDAGRGETLRGPLGALHLPQGTYVLTR